MTNQRGWMPGVEQVPAAAYGYSDLAAGSMRPIAVMSHIMQGYQRTMIAWARERPFATPKSAHFTVGRDGRIVQHVSIYDPCWAAGNVANPSWPLYRPGTNPNRYLVQIEHEGFSVPPGYSFDFCYDDAHPWPEAMHEAAIRIHRWVFAELGIEASERTVIGHFETDAVNRANDPGPRWPRVRLLEALRTGGAGPPPATPPAGEPAPGTAGALFGFDHTDRAWPNSDVARLIDAAMNGRVQGHEYVEWRGRVVPSVVILPEE